MWLAGATGLAAGLGLWSLALMACLFGAIVLALVRRLEFGTALKQTGRSSAELQDDAPGGESGASGV